MNLIYSTAVSCPFRKLAVEASVGSLMIVFSLSFTQGLSEAWSVPKERLIMFCRHSFNGINVICTWPGEQSKH